MVIEERAAKIKEFPAVKKNAIAEYFKKTIKGSPTFKVMAIYMEKDDERPRKLVIEELEDGDDFVKALLKG